MIGESDSNVRQGLLLAGFESAYMMVGGLILGALIISIILLTQIKSKPFDSA